jgi:hypothetical protein
MIERFVAPRSDEIDGLSVTFPSPGEPWVVSVVERARDGDEVRMTWDEVAASVRILWVTDGRERLLWNGRRSIASRLSVSRVDSIFG